MTNRIENTMAFMFESRAVWRTTRSALASAELQDDYFRSGKACRRISIPIDPPAICGWPPDKPKEVRVLQIDTAAPRPTLDLVLDTNVVLDWLAFGHPVGAPLEQALTSGHCRWLRTRGMRDELAHVIVRESLSRWAIDADTILATFDRLGVDVDTPPPLGAAERLPCSDPDDQPFIDLAIARRAHALLTRDRAVLRLASRARCFGVLIATPEVWLNRRFPPEVGPSLPC